MTAPSDDDLGFAPECSPEWDQPIRYIERSHAWYRALGFGTPYRYAQFEQTPFTRLRVPLAQARVALLTTAAPYQTDKGDQRPSAPYNAAAKFYAVYSGDSAGEPDLRNSHVAVDRLHAADDAACWFPLHALRRAAAAGRIGHIAPRFHGVPTNRSQRHTLAVDAPELLARLQADAVDAAVLVPNCPVCHQTMALVARHLEAQGIACVLMGAAKDIVERVGVPRFVFSDFPLGNAAARPDDVASQDSTLALALDLLAHATAPRTTVQNPLRWPGPARWRLDYMNPDLLSAEELARRRAENERAKAQAQALRDATLAAQPRTDR